MEWSPETLQFLSQCFHNTLSPASGPRQAAEASLFDAADRPNYGLAVLRFVAEPSVDDQIRQAAAVNFKNHLKFRWNPNASARNGAPVPNPIPDPEKEQIKALIVSLMLQASPRIQSQLSEALVVIGQHDFPKAWPSLLPELVSMLQKAVEVGEYVAINGILGAVNSLCKKFRYQYQTTDIRLDLKYCLDNFAAPLSQLFSQTAALIESRASSGAQAADLKPLFESQRLCCRISYSFNFQELPEYFEDHMEEWMVLFVKYLTSVYPTLEQVSGDGLAVVDGLRAAVCDILSLYMDRNEEPFEKYVETFGRAVRDLLANVSATPGRDELAVTGCKFLTTLSMRSPQNKLFAETGSLDLICGRIVIPNVTLKDEDEDVFENNFVEFIRRDIEGSDLDTRRRIACELLKAIAANYREQIIQMALHLIQGLLTKFAENPAENWKHKDCAIYLALSLSVNKAGGTTVPTGFIDVGSFFSSVVVPELQSRDVNAYPVLKAAALKFFTVFRSLLPKSSALALVPDVVRFLGSESNVVHSYAAICVDKLLLVREEGGGARYLAHDIAPFLPILMTNLFNALRFDSSEENQYVMRCIMRVLGVADVSSDFAGSCISRLTSILFEVCKNPKNPTFNHYLFEAIAVLIRRGCVNASLTLAFETSLLPSIETILHENLVEFIPYALQLLAQLVELNSSPLPPNYMRFFDLLLLPDVWKKSSDVPALVRLLQAFLRKASSELHRGGKLTQVLGIFDKLVVSPSTEDQGFFVLNTIVENLGYDVIAPHMHQIWLRLFNRLQNNKTMKFVRCFVILMSLIVVKHGWKNLVDSINAVQGYSATFVRLHNSGKKEDDPLKDIKDPKTFLLSSLSTLPGFPGGYQQVITENLDEANQKALSQLPKYSSMREGDERYGFTKRIYNTGYAIEEHNNMSGNHTMK
ncbi:hypothetical protein V2J09_005836 [Rumex salicifolius]